MELIQVFFSTSFDIPTEAATGGVLKKDIPKPFTIFTGKHLCWSLFLIKLQVFRTATLLKRLQQRCFPLNIAKVLK